MAVRVYYGADYYESDYYSADYYGEEEEEEAPVVPSIDAAIGAFSGARKTMRRLRDEEDVIELLDLINMGAEYKDAA